jgi:hypothetical protein
MSAWWRTWEVWLIYLALLDVALLLRVVYGDCISIGPLRCP